MFNSLIHKPIAVTMVLIAVLVLGIASARLLPVSLVPDIDIPQITVQVSSPNKSARELNETMIAPLRAQLIQTPHLEDITCTAKDGGGLISMTFSYGSDADYIFIDVTERIDRAMAGWPAGEERPIVARASATDIPAFYINVLLADSAANDSRFMQMSNFTRQVVVRRIEQVPEVAMVDVSGQVFPELLIVPDKEKIHAAGISEEQLSAAITGANVRLGNLSIRDGEYRFNVRFESAILSRTDIEDVWLKIGGRLYQIKDLAEVREQPQQLKGMVSSDGQQCVTLAVIKRSEARMADLKAAIDKLIEAFGNDYPDLRFVVTRDQTQLLEYSISNMIRNLIFGALFACLIIFLFMRDFKSPVLVAVTLPVSLIIAFLFFYVLGLSINIISLSGLALGLGMMVDNSIITIDNITQRWNKGETLATACTGGVREVFTPMLSSVLTTCAIFIPLIFMSGIAGSLFYDEAMSVTITLFSALAVTVLAIPVYYYRFYRRQPRFEPNRFIERIGGNGRILAGYERILKWLFRHRAVAWGVFGLSMVMAVVLFATIGKRKLPELSHTDTLVSIEWNERVTAEENNRRCNELVAGFGGMVVQSTCMAGAQQFVLSHTSETSPSEATIYIKAHTTSEIRQIENSVGQQLAERWPQAVYSCQPSGNVFDMIFSEKSAPLEARLRTTNGTAPDPESLNNILGEVRRQLSGVEVQPAEWNDYIELVADPERLALYNVSFGQLLQHLKSSMNDNSIMQISRGDVSMPVTIGVGQRQAADLVVGNQIPTAEGVIPLSVLLKETRNRDLKKITSGVEGEYYPLRLNIDGRQVRQTMATVGSIVEADSRYEVGFDGSYFTNRAMIRELCLVLLVSVLLLFLILSAQFESVVQPLIILSELVIDIAGALAVLMLAGVTLNLMSMIGLVVMCGIIINDSILKVDTINRLRRDGMNLKHAIMEAGSRRLKAIVMTSLTTILAIAPFLVRGDMGSDLQHPLSVALIAGMTVGTLVSIFFVPIAYYAIYKKNENR